MRGHETTQYTDFKRDFDGQFARMKRSSRPTVIVQKGRVAAVVMSARAYNAYLDAMEAIDARRAIEQGRRDIAAGKGMPIQEAMRSLAAELGLSQRRASAGLNSRRKASKSRGSRAS